MRDNLHLSSKERDVLKNKLLGEKERILNKSQSSDERYCLDKNELSDPLDEAAVNVQANHELRFRNRDNFFLKKIDKALKLMDEGIYGLCKSCDDPINFERLNARITAELCIGCKEEAEMEERGNFIQRKSKSMGKTLSEIGGRS